ncbi:hypothetical protein ACO0LL_06680 [Undibacterium sp. TC4M20W]|uniref:hypothetical protein n=1 Tax=Undibacterium sp. TC4M20W TaxID=3413052 RepID=UPI003BF2CB90
MEYSIITQDDLQGLADFELAQARVKNALNLAGAEGAVGLLRFFARYTSWNGFFGSGVASLSGKIGRSRTMFVDQTVAERLLNDRSVFIASFFFDAARDEFDDRDTEYRDTHRCLAQATLAGLLRYARQQGYAASTAELNKMLNEPAWLKTLNAKVAQGYGNGSEDNRDAIMAAIGYHLGSEILADREFSMIDEYLRKEQKEVTRFLKKAKQEIAGQSHPCYQWLQIHSGHGGAAEADHFEWATKGAELAFTYSPKKEHAAMRASLDHGFQTFARHHKTFFEAIVR